MPRFQARACQNPQCKLRFPVEVNTELGLTCPVCRTPTLAVDSAYATEPAPAARPRRGPTVVALLDNIRSLSNVGTIFRTADGVGVTHLHLGGVTPTPEHPKLTKTALGAEASVTWTHYPDPVAAATELVATGTRLWTLEGGSGPSLFDLVANPGSGPICLVLGHEVSGVDPRIAALSEHVTHLPMAGIKGSLNVAVAFGVAAYVVRHRLGPV